MNYYLKKYILKLWITKKIISQIFKNLMDLFCNLILCNVINAIVV